MEVVQEIIGQVADTIWYYLDLLYSIRADLIDAMPCYELIFDELDFLISKFLEATHAIPTTVFL